MKTTNTKLTKEESDFITYEKRMQEVYELKEEEAREACNDLEEVENDE